MTPTRHFESRRRQLLTLGAGLACGLLAGPALAQAGAFDHSHAAWTALLKKHVVLLDGGKASRLAYAGLAADRAALKAYLATLSAVSPAVFEGFGKAQQMAFLINAYNAWNRLGDLNDTEKQWASLSAAKLAYIALQRGDRTAARMYVDKGMSWADSASLQAIRSRL